MAITKTEYITGTQDSSPFEFYRKWKYTPASGVAQPFQYSHDYIQQQVQWALQRLLPPTVQPPPTEPTPSTSTAAPAPPAPPPPPAPATRQSTRVSKQTSFFGQIGQLLSQDIETASVHSEASGTSVAGSTTQTGSQPQPQQPQGPLSAERTLFLKKIQLQFNGVDLGKHLSFVFKYTLSLALKFDPICC